MTRVSQHRRSGFTWIDLLVVVGLIPLLAVGLMSCRRSRGEPAWRVKCASNLRQIGQAMLLYANENKGQYPQTRAGTGLVVNPVWGTGAEAKNPFLEDGPALNDVSAALFLLLRTQDITSEVFTCPKTNAQKWDYEGGNKNALDWSNWPRNTIFRNLSYSYINPYPDDAAKASGFEVSVRMSAEIAVASDLNPGVIKGTSDVLAITTTSSAATMKLGNSPNHDQDGQNVLYGDGHVEWQSNPFVGVNRDNIFTRRGDNGPTSSAPLPLARSPKDKDDSVLLPHAE